MSMISEIIFNAFNPKRLTSFPNYKCCHECRMFLVERGADNVTVTSWYHRQFAEAAQARYCPNDKVKFLHSQLAEFFDGKWADGTYPLPLYPLNTYNVPRADGVFCLLVWGFSSYSRRWCVLQQSLMTINILHKSLEYIKSTQSLFEVHIQEKMALHSFAKTVLQERRNLTKTRMAKKTKKNVT